MKFQEFVEDQVFSPTLIADGLRTTKSEIAETLGLRKDAFTRASRVRARKTQVRLRQMLEILNRVEAATGSPLAAYAWFRAEPLPGFGGATPICWCGRAGHPRCMRIWTASWPAAMPETARSLRDTQDHANR